MWHSMREHSFLVCSISYHSSPRQIGTCILLPCGSVNESVCLPLLFVPPAHTHSMKIIFVLLFWVLLYHYNAQTSHPVVMNCLLWFLLIFEERASTEMRRSGNRSTSASQHPAWHLWCCLGQGSRLQPQDYLCQEGQKGGCCRQLPSEGNRGSLMSDRPYL